MKVSEIVGLLSAKVWCGEQLLEQEVQSGCAFDMMSDVLAYGKEQAVLLTGLLNPQVVRTAEMMDIFCVVFVRGKQPTEAMIDLAREKSLLLMTTEKGMFTACGILYNAGLSD